MIKIPPNRSPAAIIPRWSAHHTHYWVLSRSGHNGAARLLRLLCRIPASLSIMITLYPHSVYNHIDHSASYDHSAPYHCTLYLRPACVWGATLAALLRSAPAQRCSAQLGPVWLAAALPSECGPSTITSTGTSCTAPTPGFRPIAEETRGRGDGGD